MIGVEICMIVSDCLKALELYEDIFELVRINVTALERGQNEAVFSISGTRFHMLDENEELQMLAPKPGDAMPVWYNVVVPDINATYDSALESGCVDLMPVTEIEDLGVLTCMFSDPFGYTWQLHEIA